MLAPPLILLAVAAAVYVFASLALLTSLPQRCCSWNLKLDKARVIDPLGPVGVRLVLLSELVTTVLLLTAVYAAPQGSDNVAGLLLGGYLSLWLWLAAALQQPASPAFLAGLYVLFMGFFVTAAAVYSAETTGPVWQHVFVWSHAAHRLVADGVYTYKMLNPAKRVIALYP